MALPVSGWTQQELDDAYACLVDASRWLRMGGRWSLSAGVVSFRSMIVEESARRSVDARDLLDRQQPLFTDGAYKFE